MKYQGDETLLSVFFETLQSFQGHLDVKPLKDSEKLLQGCV